MREEYDSGFGHLSFDLPCRVDAIHLWKRDIGHDQSGPQFKCSLNERYAVTHFANNVKLAGQQFADAFGNKDVIIGGLSNMAKDYPGLFSVGLFVTSMLLYSQAATTKTLMPLGLSLGVPAASLAGMFPAVNGYFFIPTYGTLIAAVNFDRSGTTRIGKYVLNHSFMLPGLVSTVVAVLTGLTIAKLFF